MLIIKRITRKLTLSRLMVGHTHCDIDAVFGRIWLPMRVSYNSDEIASN
jgi:hypothetical protein